MVSPKARQRRSKGSRRDGTGERRPAKVSFGKQETFGDLEAPPKDAAAPETSRFSQAERGADFGMRLEGEAVQAQPVGQEPDAGSKAPAPSANNLSNAADPANSNNQLRDQ